MTFSIRFPIIFVTVFLFALSSAAEDHLHKTYPTNLAPSAQLYYLVTAERSGFTLNGEADVSWQVTGSPPKQTYSITTETRAAIFGKIVEANSFGRIDEFGLAPDKYEETSRKKPAFQTTFDRATKKITFSESDKIFPLHNGEQDRTSAVWQLVSIARASSKKLTPKSKLAFFVAGRRDSEKWTFSVEKNVTLVTSLGKIATVHITKKVSGPKDQRIDIWLAPSMEWYPVRIKFRDVNGDTIEQNLERIKLENNS